MESVNNVSAVTEAAAMEERKSDEAGVVEGEKVSEAEEPAEESLGSPTADHPETTDSAQTVPGPTAFSDKALERLVSGVVSHLLPEFQRAKNTLNDLNENQRILIETVTAENAKFDECAAMKDVMDVMEKAKLYHTKLLHIKKDMSMLHEKSAKLKRRALKLQQQKQKEALEREANREREMEKERMLIAQPSGGGNVL